MSNTWLNVRFGVYHLQILMFSDWRLRGWREWFRWSRNAWQVQQRETDPDWRWFALYECRWPW